MSRITALTTADAAEAAAIHAAGFDRGWSAAEIADLLAEDTVLGLAARTAAGRLVAFILVRHVAGEADILTLATAPDARRQGLGRALLAGAADALAARKAERIMLDVAADNAPALALYRGMGFTEDGRRPGYYARKDASGAQFRVDALLLSTPIARIAGLYRRRTSFRAHDTD